MLALRFYHLSSSVLLQKSFVVLQQDVIMEKWEKRMITISKLLLITMVYLPHHELVSALEYCDYHIEQQGVFFFFSLPLTV